MKKNVFLFFLLILSFNLSSQDNSNFSIYPEFPEIILSNTEVKIPLLTYSSEDYRSFSKINPVVNINGENKNIIFSGRDEAYINYKIKPEDKELALRIGNEIWIEKINPIPLWMSIIPPLIAILLALLIREVITSLFIGIFSGALIIGLYNEGISSILFSFLKVVDTYVVRALYDKNHISVIIFSMTIAAVVSVISKMVECVELWIN
jgi:hypothetical protein